MRNRFLVTDSYIVTTQRKEEDEVLTWTLDYTKLLSRLSTDTISTSTWVEDASNLTIDSESESAANDTTTVTVSGGNGGNTVYLENTVVTTGGLTLKRAIKVDIIELGTPTLDYDG